MSKQDREKQHKTYLKEMVNPIVEKLIVELLITKPKTGLDVVYNFIFN